MDESARLSRDAIAHEYKRLGHAIGWRLFTCPERNIDTASVALIGLNPGGNVIDTVNPDWEQKNGSAYVVERWKDKPPGAEKLQQQVQRLFEIIKTKPDNVLSGYLVPFRSPDWDSLPHKPESLAFGVQIWAEIFRRANPKIVITLGKETGVHVRSLLNPTAKSATPIGWGKQTVDAYKFGGNSYLIVLPHLSRFGIFGHPQRDEAFRQLIQKL